MSERCESCAFWQSKCPEADKGTCGNPVRKDNENHHYYGYLRKDDYCALHTPKEEFSVETTTSAE